MDLKLLKLYGVTNSDIIIETIKILDKNKGIISGRRVIKIQNFLEKNLQKEEKHPVENLHDIIIRFPELEGLKITFQTRAQKSFENMLQHMSDYYMNEGNIEKAENILKQIS